VMGECYGKILAVLACHDEGLGTMFIKLGRAFDARRVISRCPALALQTLLIPQAK